jgi:NAD(P)-dependent dehydrogenase (short-subunit alcohol dehydrogenase family)
MTAAPRSVLVTGASRGLGRDMALHLARSGFRVFAGVRRDEDGGKLQEEGGAAIQPVLLDVVDSRSIAAARDLIAKTVGEAGLDGLVNNAGLASFGPLEQQPLEEFEELFRVNLFGVVALTQAMLPLLRKARGRLVNVSSGNGKLSMPFTAAYSASKFALEALSDALRGELRPFGIRVVVVQPGAMATDIRVKGVEAWARAHERLPDNEKALYARALEAIYAAIHSWEAGAGPPADVSDAVLRALTDPEPLTRYPIGPMMDQLPALLAMPDTERDRMAASMLGLASD